MTCFPKSFQEKSEPFCDQSGLRRCDAKKILKRLAKFASDASYIKIPG